LVVAELLRDVVKKENKLPCLRFFAPRLPFVTAAVAAALGIDGAIPGMSRRTNVGKRESRGQWDRTGKLGQLNLEQTDEECTKKLLRERGM
jgi:hypothetical protein